MGDRITVGVISDTHGIIREEALFFLKGSDLIVHAGDIGSRDVLSALEQVASVMAVRGNTDYGEWASSLPSELTYRVRGKTLYVCHILDEKRVESTTEDIDLVIFGHTHRPSRGFKGGIYYFNPGSAGHRRWRGRVSIGRIMIEKETISSEIIELPD